MCVCRDDSPKSPTPQHRRPSSRARLHAPEGEGCSLASHHRLFVVGSRPPRTFLFEPKAPCNNKT